MEQGDQAKPSPAWTMPRFTCHKTVSAVKIARIEQAPADQERANPGGDWYLVPDSPRYGRVLVGHAYITKHNPQPGGYYVRYEDGYESYSPAAAFESGYTRIDEDLKPAKPGVGVERLSLLNVRAAFTYQPWTADQQLRGAAVVGKLIEAAEAALLFVPECPTRTRGLNNLIDARMLFNAAITHDGRF